MSDKHKRDWLVEVIFCVTLCGCYSLSAPKGERERERVCVCASVDRQ